MIRALPLLAMFLFAPSAATHGGPAADPLAGLMPRPIDIEVSEAPVRDVFGLVGEITQTTIVVEDCVEGTIDLQLDNVTIRMLLEAMAHRLELTYARSPNGSLLVSCGTTAEPSTVTMHVRDAAVSPVLARIASVAGATIRVRGCDAHRIDLDVQHAPVVSLVAGLASELGADHRWTSDALVFECPR